MFLLKYLSDGTDYISVIQSVCGAPKDTVIFIKLAAVFLTAFLLSLPGVALHALLYGPVFGRLNLVDGLVYQARDYLIIILISCIASAACVSAVCRLLRARQRGGQQAKAGMRKERRTA